MNQATCPSCGALTTDGLLCVHPRHCMWTRCPKTNFVDDAINMCEAHAQIIADRVDAILDAQIAEQEQRQAQNVAQADENERRKGQGLESIPDTAEYPDCVYYLKVGDHIKIGTTANLPRRLAAYPPESELLGVEAGGKQFEKYRHSQFGAYLAWGREWFQDRPEIRAHIATLPLIEEMDAGRRQMRPGPSKKRTTLRARGYVRVR